MKKEIADEDIYNEKDAEELKAGDEISEIEEGIVEGYKEDLTNCALCGKLVNTDEPIELKIKGKHYIFCSEKHAAEFKKEHK